MRLKSIYYSFFVCGFLSTALFASDLKNEGEDKLKVTYKGTVYSLKEGNLVDPLGNKLKASPIRPFGKNTTFGPAEIVVIPKLQNKELIELIMDPHGNIKAVYNAGLKLDLYKIL